MTDAMLPETVPIGIVAELLGISTRQARNLLDGAKVKPATRGQWQLAPSVQAILAVAREDRSSTDYTRARARAVNAKARQTELAIGEKEREVIPIEDAIAPLDIVMGVVVEELSGLAARCTRELEQRRRIEAEINASRLRMAAAVRGAVTAMRDGTDIVGHDE